MPQEAWNGLILLRQARTTNSREDAAPTCRLVPSLAHQSEEDRRSFDRAARFGLKISAHLGVAPDSPHTPRSLYSTITVPGVRVTNFHMWPFKRFSAWARHPDTFVIVRHHCRRTHGRLLSGSDLFGGLLQSVVEQDVVIRDNRRKTTEPPHFEPFREEVAKPPASGRGSYNAYTSRRRNSTIPTEELDAEFITIWWA